MGVIKGDTRSLDNGSTGAPVVLASSMAKIIAKSF